MIAISVGLLRKQFVPITIAEIGLLNFTVVRHSQWLNASELTTNTDDGITTFPKSVYANARLPILNRPS